MPNTIAYLRVSTSTQADSGLGLSAQRESIESFIASKGYEHIQWFEDAGVSGAAGIHNRPGLADAIAAVDRGGVLLVAKLDRLSHDEFMSAWIRMKIETRGASIVSCAGEGTDDESPAGKLMRAIVSAFASYEREMIASRTRAARAVQRSKGAFCGGAVPYGFTRKGDGLIPNPEELGTIAIARNLRGKRVSWSEIGKTLIQKGHKPRKAKKWHINQLRRICK